MGLLEELKRSLDDVTVESSRLARLTGLNLDLVSLRGQRDAALRELGRQALAAADDGSIQAPQIIAAAEVARDLDRRVTELEAEIERLRSESSAVRAVANALDPRPRPDSEPTVGPTPGPVSAGSETAALPGVVAPDHGATTGGGG